MKVKIDIDGDGVDDVTADLDTTVVKKLLYLKLAAVTGTGALICEYLVF